MIPVCSLHIEDRMASAYTLNALSRKFVPSKVDSSQLVRSLGVADLVAYGIASTVGAGIFVITGEVARCTAGPGIIVSFLVAAFASLMSGLCYAEFAARIPVSGSLPLDLQ